MTLHVNDASQRAQPVLGAYAASRFWPKELLTYFDLPGEASVARRLGQNATHGVVRVALEAKRRAASDWALRNLSDAQLGVQQRVLFGIGLGV